MLVLRLEVEDKMFALPKLFQLRTYGVNSRMEDHFEILPTPFPHNQINYVNV